MLPLPMSEPTPPTRSRVQVPTTVFAVLLGLGVVLAAVMESSRTVLLPPGAAAPETELRTLDGARVKLSSLRGRWVLVDFWATWCPPCVEEMPYLVKLAEAYGPRGLAFLAVNQDGDGEIRDVEHFAAKVAGLRPYVALAPAGLPSDWRVEALPTLYLVGPDGTVVERRRGQVSEAWLRALLDKHLPAGAGR
jgi:thiol-disulfide isomerase/thioredoxin